MPVRRSPLRSDGGFTLLEVLIALAILAISLTSLLTSQMSAIRATRYAQSVTVAAFLAEYQLIEIERIVREEEQGWGDSDKEFSGDFAEQGWPDITYACMVDMVELPEHNAIAQAADAEEGDEALGGVQSSGESAFDAMGMVWPIVKGAIEQAIRKVACTVSWQDGEITHDFTLETFWSDPAKLAALPGAGGEVTREEDDPEGEGEAGEGGAGGAGEGGGGLPGAGQNGPFGSVGGLQ